MKNVEQPEKNKILSGCFLCGIVNISALEFRSIKLFLILGVWIVLVGVFDHGVGNAAGYIITSAFRTDRGLYGHGGIDDLAVFLRGLFVGIGYMLTLVCADSGACGLWRDMRCRLK